MEKLAIFKRVKDGKEYYSVYKVIEPKLVGERKSYELIGFLSSYQVDCAVHSEYRVEVK